MSCPPFAPRCPLPSKPPALGALEHDSLRFKSSELVFLFRGHTAWVDFMCHKFRAIAFTCGPDKLLLTKKPSRGVKKVYIYGSFQISIGSAP